MPNIETNTYWDAAAEGKLLLKHCIECGKSHHYPRSLCPFCFSDRTEWVQSAGRGVIYAFSIARRANPVYAVAYVRLHEGPTVLTNLVDSPVDQIRIGQPVRVTFQSDSEGRVRPYFVLESTTTP